MPIQTPTAPSGHLARQGQLAPKAAQTLKKPKKISRHTADRHEAVFVRLSAVAKTVDALARKRADRVVPDAVRKTAEAALFDAQHFLAHGRRSFPMAALHAQPLAVQLGASLAALLAFQHRYAQWDKTYNAVMWQVKGLLLPVRRFKQDFRSPFVKKPMSKQRMDELREKLAIRIEQFATGKPAKLSPLFPPPDFAPYSPHHHAAMGLQRSTAWDSRAGRGVAWPGSADGAPARTHPPTRKPGAPRRVAPHSHLHQGRILPRGTIAAFSRLARRAGRHFGVSHESSGRRPRRQFVLP